MGFFSLDLIDVVKCCVSDQNNSSTFMNKGWETSQKIVHEGNAWEQHHTHRWSNDVVLQSKPKIYSNIAYMDADGEDWLWRSSRGSSYMRYTGGLNGKHKDGAENPVRLHIMLSKWYCW